MSQAMGTPTTALLLVLALSLGGVCPCISNKNLGNLYPRDNDYLIGSNVTLNCNLTAETVELFNQPVQFKSSFIRFRHGFVDVKPSDIEILGPLEAAFTIVNGQAEDSGPYYCQYQLPSRQKPFLICPTIINFGYPPAEVQNFTCRSIAWESLVCKWDIPPNSAPVTYRVSYSTYNFQMNYPCPFNQARRGSCRWSTDTKPIYIKNVPELTLHIEGTNGLGKIYQEFHYQHYEIVIPGIPLNLIVASIGTDWMFLNWDPPRAMRPDMFKSGVCYRVLYKTSYQESFKIEELVPNEGNFTISGLIPNTWYTVKVQGRSCVAPNNEDMWGPEEQSSGQTKPDIPWSPPEAPFTSFDTVTYKKSRNITVYWKLIPKEYYNAGNFRYLVSVSPTFVERHRRELSHSREWSGTTHHVTFDEMEVESAYEFRIRSYNEMGASVNVTRIIVPKLSAMPPRPSYIQPISMGGGKYRVTWLSGHVSDNSKVDGYTLFWCRSSQTSRCEYDLHWEDVAASASSKDLMLNDKVNYDFAVAAYSAGGRLGSGLEWASCTVHWDRAVDRVGGVSARAEGPRQIRVSWKLACEAQKAVVIQYAIYLCKSNCGNTCTGADAHTLINDSQAESVMLKDLQPFTEYGVSLVVISRAGRSEASRITCVNTPYEAPSDAPHQVTLANVTNDSAMIKWHPPVHPNGRISHYILYYNDKQEEVKLDAIIMSPPTVSDGKDYSLPQELMFNLTKLNCFTNYTVRIKACVRELCSNLSSPLSVRTKIGFPGPMDPPRTEVLNSSHVLVTWKPPEHSNGPVNFYLLHLYRQQGENLTCLDRLNVTGKSVLIPVDCPAELRASEDGTHLFEVQAVNVRQNQELLKGPLSGPTKTKLCYPGNDMDYPLIIGIVIGCTLALAFVILALYAAVRWMKSKVDMMKDIKVQLPSGLETPYSNSYENFKNGLKSRGSDPNLSPKLGYGRMDSYNGSAESPADDSFKNRHGSGASHFSAASTDELLTRQAPGGQVSAIKTTTTSLSGKGERNPSGDSSSGHDSISSSLTHRTNLSSCDGSSASSTEEPRTRDPHTSRDSGLEEEGKPLTRVPPCPSAPASHLPASVYSKLGLLEGGCIPDYLPIPRGRHLNLHSNYLANSEPSITELPDDFQNDPPSPDVPYSKFGLSHSVTDLMLENMESPDSLLSSQHSPQESMPYSRFGLRRQPPSQKSPYITVGMALLTGPQKDPKQLLASKVGPPVVLKSPSKKNKEEDEVEPDKAYSKLGMSLPLPEQNSPAKSKGYVTLEEIKLNEQNHSLPDLTISSSRDGSPTMPESEQSQRTESPSRSGYLPHQLIAPVKAGEVPALPDVVNCSNVLPLSVVLQETPEVKVQGNNGYVVLNEALAKNTNV